VKYYSPATSTLILRCARERVRFVWAALTLITHLTIPPSTSSYGGSGSRQSDKIAERIPCVLRVVHNAGTIKKSEEKIIQLARQDILRVTVAGSKGLEGVLGLAADDDHTKMEVDNDDMNEVEDSEEEENDDD
jgi:ribonuclease P/MRP protein subunit POP5